VQVDARCAAGNMEEDQLIESWQQKQHIRRDSWRTKRTNAKRNQYQRTQNVNQTLQKTYIAQDDSNFINV
jgi:uncharacterized protein involved in type VI secretion and phage assembly